jgi:hypothetical protein
VTDSLFSGMETPPITWPFGQPWLVQTEPAFAPGHVTLGLSENELVVRAELHDVHVTQDVFPFNFPAFMHYDAFFGRYDYTPGQPKPMISSTSPHAICNFHCREEWRRVRLADLSENFGAVPRFMGVK